MASSTREDPKTSANEFSGVHDIRALARESMERTAVRPPSEQDLHDMAARSPASLGQVALPTPARQDTARPKILAQGTKELPSLRTSAPGVVRQSSTIPSASALPSEMLEPKRTSAGWWWGFAVVLVASGATWGAVQKWGQSEPVTAGAASPALADEQVQALRPLEAPRVVKPTGPVAVVTEGAGPEVTPQPEVEPLAAANGAGTPPAGAEAVAAAVAPAVAADEDDKKSDKSAKSAKSDKLADSTITKIEGADLDKAAARVAAAQAPAEKPAIAKLPAKTEEPRAASGAVDTSMDDLLNQATGNQAEPKAAPAGDGAATAVPAKAKLPSKLERGDVRKGMSAVRARVQTCYQELKVSGKVDIEITVDPSGKVSSSKAKGEFAGTPTGTCVADAAAKASFPAWEGESLTFSYPFLLE